MLDRLLDVIFWILDWTIGIALLIAHIVVVLWFVYVVIPMLIQGTKCLHFWWGASRSIGWGC